MNGKKRWTAQEMRDEANRLAEGEKNCTGGESKHISMLRQGAELQERMEAVEYACGQAKKLVSQISMPLKLVNGLCSTDPMIATGLGTIIAAVQGNGAK